MVRVRGMVAAARAVAPVAAVAVPSLFPSLPSLRVRTGASNDERIDGYPREREERLLLLLLLLLPLLPPLRRLPGRVYPELIDAF